MTDPPDWLHLSRGTAPLLISMPHTGTDLPGEVRAQLSSVEAALVDTDCWLERLYDFAPSLGATIVRTTLSRTVIDVNRDPSGASLYPGQTTTGLCPLTAFDGEAFYRAGHEPDAAEIERRRLTYFDPYHTALRVELERLRTLHQRIVLYDAHSIRSHVPRLFAGRLPDCNIGTFDGRSCDPSLTRLIETACSASAFTQITNGRFKGGWITRHYGEPERGVHAVQMELARSSHLDETDIRPFPPYDEARAEPLRALLQTLLTKVIAWSA